MNHNDAAYCSLCDKKIGDDFVKLSDSFDSGARLRTQDLGIYFNCGVNNGAQNFIVLHLFCYQRLLRDIANQKWLTVRLPGSTRN